MLENDNSLPLLTIFSGRKILKNFTVLVKKLWVCYPNMLR